MEEEEKGVSLMDIFHTIYLKRWLGLIVGIAVAVVFTVAMYFGMNASGGRYEISFTLSMPNDTSPSVYTYPDSDRFYYSDYTSDRVLEEVKASDEDFGGINIKKMISKNDISCKETATEIKNGESSLYTHNVTVSVKAKYFSNEGVAKKFLSALAYYPIGQFAEKDVDYNVYLNGNDFENAIDFSAQVDYLKKEISYLSGLYNSLGNVVDDNGVSAAIYKQQFTAWSERQDLDSILSEAASHRYLKNWESEIAKYESDVIGLNEQIEDTQNILANIRTYLKENNIPSADAASVIASFEEKYVNLARRRTTIFSYFSNYYEGDVSEEDPVTHAQEFQFTVTETGERIVKADHVKATEDYAKKIRTVYEQLTSSDGFIRQYEELSKQLNVKSSSISYISPNVIASTGGIGLLKAAILGVVIGLVIGVVTAYVAGYVSQFRVRRRQRVPAEAQAALAVTEEPSEEVKDNPSGEDKQ